MLSKVGNRIRDWLSSLSESDKEWEEEFEREIDAQVDAVFKMVKEMDGDEHPDTDGGMLTGLTDDAQFMKTMSSLTENMKRRRQKNRFNFPVFLLVFTMSVLLIRYSNPAMWWKSSTV